jgi:hypothetical protein
LANGVPVDVTVTAVGSQAADELRSLRQWLVAEEELRGRVGDREHERPNVCVVG